MLNASAPKRVLIIKLQHHGDVLLATPVADALKQAWPDCEIDMLEHEMAMLVRTYAEDLER